MRTNGNEYIESGVHVCNAELQKKKFKTKTFVKNIKESIENSYVAVPRLVGSKLSKLSRADACNLPPKKIIQNRVWRELQKIT